MMRSASRENGRVCRYSLPRPLQRGQEQPLAAEEHGLQVARHLDVVVQGGREGDDAAGVDADGLALQLLLDDRAAGVDEGQAVALQALQDEALAAEQAGAEALGEGDADAGAQGGAQEGVLLAQQLAARAARLMGTILPG